MPAKIYNVTMNAEERSHLQSLVSTGKVAAYKRLRAQILLKADQSPAQPGEPERYDYEYERNGTSNLFMISTPLEGWRHVEVTDLRTVIDWARRMKD